MTDRQTWPRHFLVHTNPLRSNNIATSATTPLNIIDSNFFSLLKVPHELVKSK